MKISRFMCIIVLFICSSELIPQSDTNINLKHSDSSMMHDINTFHQQAPASTYIMDANFIQHVYGGNMLEVELSKLAENKSESESVKQYARMIESDHNNTASQLKTLAENINISIDPAIPSESRKKVDDLSELIGASFDKEFINLMVDDNKNNIQQYETASLTVNDPELKSWINKTLPTLKAHLNEAENIQKELNKM